MKDFIVQELTIKDFKGQTMNISLDARGNVVKGSNGVGKTTIYKAFCWLLTGYTDAITSKNYELYDNTKEITKDTPTAIVRAKVLVDGIDYTIERRAKAKFVKKRGEDEWIKDSSDSYIFLIDDIETSASEFSSWIERIFGSSDLLTYMIIGERFANLTIEDKSKARKILEQLVGEISDNDMNGDYSIIKKQLCKFTPDELHSRLKKELKTLKDASNECDIKIGIWEKELEQYNDCNFEGISTRIEELSNELLKIDKCIQDKRTSANPLEVERKKVLMLVSEKSREIIEKESAYNQRCSDELHIVWQELKNAQMDNEEIKKQNIAARTIYQGQCHAIKTKRNLLDDFNKRREALVEQRNKVKSRVFNEEICQYCHQPLPPIEIEEARVRFNKQKQEELELIITKGKAVKESIDELNNEINQLEEIVSKGQKEIELVDVEKLEKAYNDKKKSQVPFKETEEYSILAKELEELKANIPNIVNVDDDERKRRDAIVEELNNLRRALDKKTIFDHIQRDINETKSKKREIGNELANIECCIDKVKEYEDEKANIVSERINNKLKGCMVSMYSRQKDGELKPDCVIINEDGIKYATLNNSARNLVCLSLQRMFCEHFGVNMPIFVDDAERYSSNNLPTFNSQTIYLFVSNDNKLVIETK